MTDPLDFARAETVDEMAEAIRAVVHLGAAKHGLDPNTPIIIAAALSHAVNLIEQAGIPVKRTLRGLLT